MADRDEVWAAVYDALLPFDLHNYADGVMDSLDTVIEWDDEGDDTDG